MRFIKTCLLSLHFSLIFSQHSIAQQTYHVAGGTSNGFKIKDAFGYRPRITFDANNNTYVAISANEFAITIRKYDFKHNLVQTIAGNNSLGSFKEGAKATQSPLTTEYLLRELAMIVDNNENVYYLTQTYLTAAGKIIKVSKDGIITTYAGTDSSGYSGDNGPAALAQFNKPNDMALDKKGNIIIADANNNRIRKIDKNGIITTIAGIGVAGYSGDGGSALKAKLHTPSLVTSDKFGNIYLYDQFNECVRKIDSSGVITTVLNRKQFFFASRKQLFPYKIITDTSGNLIIDNYGSNLLRFSTDTTFSAIAESFQFNDVVTSIAINSNNELFACDSYTIYKISNDNVVDTVSGNNYGNSYFDNEPYVEAYGSNREGNIACSKINHNFYTGESITKIFLADSANGRLKLIVGNGELAYKGDGGKAVDAALRFKNFCTDNKGNIFLTDNIFQRVRKIDSAGIITKFAGTNIGNSGDGGPATNAQLNNPAGIATDSKGNVYIADVDNSTIRKINAATNIITTYAGTGRRGFSGDGGLAVNAALYNPQNIALDDEDNLYISDTENKRIRKVSKNGIITTIAGNGASNSGQDSVPALATGIGKTQALGISEGNLYFVSGSSPYLFKVNLRTGLLTKVQNIGFTNDIAVDVSGNIYFGTNESIDKINFSCSTNHIAGSSSLQYMYVNQPTMLQQDCKLIAFIEPTGNRNEAVNSIIKAQVFVDKSVVKKANRIFAKRYYGFTPQLNIKAATSKITLFFRQEEFTDYNKNKNINSAPLPSDPLDNAAKKNILIVQAFDTSVSDYKNIYPAAKDVIWNDSLKCWQVSFHSAGLGGFLLTSKPVDTNNSNLIAGKTINKNIKIAPNPTSDFINLSVSSSLSNTQIELLTIEGKVLLNQVIKGTSTKVNLKNYASGIYLLKFADDTVCRIIKQ